MEGALLLCRKSVLPEIENVIASVGELRVAVAFWGRGSAKLFETSRDQPTKILCNLESGACNPQEIATLLSNFPATLKSNRNLHAKIWCSDDSLILGSSNASANGLALEGDEVTGWHEANICIRDQGAIREAQSWFDDLWDDELSQHVTGEMIREAELLWQKRRNQRPVVKLANTAPDFLSDLLLRPERLQDRSVFVSIYRWRASNLEAETKEQADRLGLDVDDLDVYEGWHWNDETRTDNLPAPGTAVIDFDSSSSEWGVFTILNVPVSQRDGIPLLWATRSTKLAIGSTVYDLSTASDDLRDLILSVPTAKNDYLPLSDFIATLKAKDVFHSSAPATWRDYVYQALQALGGEAKLAEIYDEVRRSRIADGKSTPRHLQAVVRKELELNSPDSEVHHTRDLFRMARGRGAGVWRLT
ncbi:MAG: hypothetical protein EON58_04995 [Alphaproteobacteria bacterium]|nr:MAG: hypothetical protein EON58_04995 [Alphaproteobacteria bacterium]